MSPLATPLLMMSALRSGRYRLPIAPMSSRTRTIASVPSRTAADRSAAGRSSRRLRPWLRPLAAGGPRPRARATGPPRGRPERRGGRAGTPGARRRRAGRAAGRGARGAAPSCRGRPRGRPRSGSTRTTRRSSSSWLALDEAALLHPADDPGRARDRHVERVGELRHRQRAVRLEDRQDVEMDQAERALEPRPEHAASARCGLHDVISPTSSAMIASRSAGSAGRLSEAPNSVCPALIFNDTLTIYAARRTTSSGGVRRQAAIPRAAMPPGRVAPPDLAP